MPDFSRGVRPIVYPGGSYRTSRQVAAMNDEHSSERLPEHKEFVLEHPSGDGYEALMAEILKYNAIGTDEAEVWITRMLIDPAMVSDSNAYGTTILGVKCRLVKV